jgi:hypothetical protein
MKINQLFTKMMTEEVLHKLLTCYNLTGLHDSRMFSKRELEQLGTVNKVNELIEELGQYYLKCKARLYLTNITTKKCLTILKQVVRLFNFSVESHEKNINNRKVIYYQLAENKTDNTHMIESKSDGIVLKFD